MTSSVVSEKADIKSPLSTKCVELIQKIKDFMKFLNENSDTSSSRLLQVVIEHMKKQNVVDRANRETSSDLRENLKKIKSTLSRMKKQDVAERSYANVVKKSVESRTEAMLSQWNVEKILKKKRLIKKLTIKIINAEDVVKIKKMNSKKIIKIIQTQVDEITKVRRFFSDDIRMHIRFKKAKIELQKSENL